MHVTCLLLFHIEFQLAGPVYTRRFLLGSDVRLIELVTIEKGGRACEIMDAALLTEELFQVFDFFHLRGL